MPVLRLATLCRGQDGGLVPRRYDGGHIEFADALPHATLGEHTCKSLLPDVLEKVHVLGQGLFEVFRPRPLPPGCGPALWNKMPLATWPCPACGPRRLPHWDAVGICEPCILALAVTVPSPVVGWGPRENLTLHVDIPPCFLPEHV